MTSPVSSSDLAYLLYSVLPLDSLWGLGRAYGKLTYLARRGDRETVRRNLTGTVGATAGRAEIDVLTRRFFEYKRVRGLMLAVSPRLTERELGKLLPIEGLEHLEAALERRRGAILLGSHLNSVCLFPAVRALRDRGYDVRVAMPERADPWPPTAVRTLLERRFDTKPLSELIGAFYAQFNIRPIVRALAENATVASTGDGLHSARFVDVEFLGRRLPFPTGMFAVAQMTGAAVVPVFQLGAPPDALRVAIEEPWTVEPEEVRRGALQQRVAAYARRLEHHLRENLACWEHWLIEDTLATIASWPQRSLEERYAV